MVVGALAEPEQRKRVVLGRFERQGEAATCRGAVLAVGKLQQDGEGNWAQYQ